MCFLTISVHASNVLLVGSVLAGLPEVRVHNMRSKDAKQSVERAVLPLQINNVKTTRQQHGVVRTIDAFTDIVKAGTTGKHKKPIKRSQNSNLFLPALEVA